MNSIYSIFICGPIELRYDHGFSYACAFMLLSPIFSHTPFHRMRKLTQRRLNSHNWNCFVPVFFCCLLVQFNNFFSNSWKAMWWTGIRSMYTYCSHSHTCTQRWRGDIKYRRKFDLVSDENLLAQQYSSANKLMVAMVVVVTLINT